MHEPLTDEGSHRGIVRRILYGESDTRLRATWRVLVPLVIAVTAYIIGQVLIQSLSTTLFGGDVDGVMVAAFGVVSLGGLALVIGVSARGGLLVASRLDRRPITSYGFEFSSRWSRDFIAGALIGVGASLATVGYQSARGYATISADVTGVGVESVVFGTAVFLLMLVFFLANNTFEEVLFRAILIPTAAEGLGSRAFGRVSAVAAAVGISLPAFGALHFLGGGGLSVVLTSAIGGILFATAYVLTGQLALPIGVHFGGVVIVSIHQTSVSADPELTLPSLLTAENTANGTLAIGLEVWTVRMLIGVALICLWVYLTYGSLSITERVYPADESDN